MGSLVISTLPKSPPGSLCQIEGELGESLASIQITEGHEYLYEWEGGANGVRIEPAELFQPDAIGVGRGRLRPALSTGLVRVQVSSGSRIGLVDLEVRSTKLDYLSEYRWMLRDIADGMSELVMSRFAASNMTFAVDPGRDAGTLYQRFAFLQSLLESESFECAIGEVFRRPHVAWEEEEEACRIGQPMRPGSYVARELTRAGPRASYRLGELSSVPRALRSRRTEATHDTTPNRFVLFALTRWLQVVSDIGERLKTATQSNVVEKRGIAEVVRVMGKLEQWIDRPLLKEVGPLDRFPAEDQVLQRRAGYRDVLKAYLEFELAARLSWKSIEDSYLAGQRDVAELYEYWAFIQLSHIVASIVGANFDIGRLIETTPDGLNVLLRKGREQVLSGTVQRFSRRLDVALCFNRTYSQANQGSWSRNMRPDYSLVIAPSKEEAATFTPVVLHFDAKYRVKRILEILGEEEADVTVEAEASSDTSERREVLRDDLLKMHTYRDAIRRTAGAYVLYPGGDEGQKPFKEYHELLPGLGAFVLRPTREGPIVGSDFVRKFVVDVLDHVAIRLTRHERGRFSLEQSYAVYEAKDLESQSGIGTHPSRETSITLGFVRDGAHWAWILESGVYNVRADDRPGALMADSQLLFNSLLLLYGPVLRQPLLVRIVSEPEWVGLEGMAASGYPNPRGSYWCVQIAPASKQPDIERIDQEEVAALAVAETGLHGAPAGVRWGELVDKARGRNA